jgi:mannosylfructose-phosphate synthase
MQHIVFLSPHSDPEARIGEVDSGGQCIYELELAKALSAFPDTQVTIYCRRKFDYPEVSYINKSFTIKRITCGGDQFIPKERLGPFIDEFCIKVASDLRTNPPTIVHGHYWDGGKASLLLANYIKKDFPILWTPHSLGSAKRRNFPGIENERIFNFIPRIAWENYTMLQADAIVVSTEDERHRILQDYTIDDNKIQVIPPGVSAVNTNVISKQKSRKFLGLPEEATIIMTLGRLDKRKGYHNCIKSFETFCQINPTNNAVLVIFSGKKANFTKEEQEYFNELNKLIADNHLEDRVILKDAVGHADVTKVYSASDIYMCLSEYEPLGLTVMEAMLMKLPVIATSNGGPVNLIQNEKTGILSKPDDDQHIAQALDKLVKNPQFARQIATAGQVFIESSYAWEARAKEFYELYETLQVTTQSNDFQSSQPMDISLIDNKPMMLLTQSVIENASRPASLNFPMSSLRNPLKNRN